MCVYIHLANGFEEIEAITVVDVLRRASVAVQTVSIGEEKMVTGAHGIRVEADLLFQDADYQLCEMLVFPGGMPGTLNLKEHSGLKKELIAFNENKKWIAAICAAPMILGELGILKDIEAIIYPGMEKYLIGAKITEQRVVQAEHIITAKGPGTAMEFALKLVELLTDERTKQSLEKDMVI